MTPNVAGSACDQNLHCLNLPQVETQAHPTATADLGQVTMRWSSSLSPPDRAPCEAEIVPGKVSRQAGRSEMQMIVRGQPRGCRPHADTQKHRVGRLRCRRTSTSSQPSWTPTATTAAPVTCGPVAYHTGP